MNDFRDVLEFVGENIERLADGDLGKIYILVRSALSFLSWLRLMRDDRDGAQERTFRSSR